MSHTTLTDETLSAEQEQRLLKAGEALFGTRFPNPDRTDCPGTEVLREMASRQLSSISDDFLDHLTHCSPCFVEYNRHLARVRRIRLLRAVAACVGLVALIGLAVWSIPGMLNSGEQSPISVEGRSHRTETVAVLDLRNASQTRGGQQETQPEPPLTVPRSAKTLQIYLPIGSEEGDYEAGLFRSKNQLLARAQGSAEFDNQTVALKVAFDLSSVAPGAYLLGFRRPEFSWHYYMVNIEEQ